MPEAVRALDGYGDGISDTVYNYVDFESKQFVKRVNVEAFDGTESFSARSTNGAGLYVYSISTTKHTNTEPLTTDFNFAGFVDGVSNVQGGTDGDGTMYLYYKSSGSTSAYFVSSCATVAEFKQSIAGKKFYAELYTPEVIDISNLLTDNLIPVEGGGTLTFKNEYEYAVPHKFTYYKTDIKIKGTVEKAVCDAEGNDIAAKFKALEAELATLKASLS
jgi:hypothetical protein